MAENFNLIFGSNAPDSTTWSDADYQTGWATAGSTPPTAEQFDFLQNRADLKAKELNDALTPLVQEADKNNRQPSTAYAVNDIAYNADLPTGWYLLCTTAGTSSSSDLSIVSPTLEATVSDGTVVWTIKKIGSTDGVLTREITPAFNTRDVITTSGTYTAPVTGWYKITAKGGGGGGAKATQTNLGGGGGGEGGTTIAYVSMTAGDTASVVIGAGGTGGATTTGTAGTNGGNTSVTINGNTYTGGGGYGGAQNVAGDYNVTGGLGGNGTIIGCAGGGGTEAQYYATGGSGGGEGGGISPRTAPTTTANGQSGGGGGGVNNSISYAGAGGDGFVWFEYFATI